MSKIIKFANEDSCGCPVCNLINKYLNKIIDSNDEDELIEYIEKLILEAGDIGRDKSFITGYEEGFADGYRKALQVDIEIKEQILEEIDEQCQCECDDSTCSCECTVKFE